VGQDTSLLDIACGPGLALMTAARRGATVAGIDVSTELVRIARSGSGRGETTSFTSCRYPDRKRPQMIEVDVFVEHLIRASSETDPRLAVRDVLGRALASTAFEDAFHDPIAGLNVLFNSHELTVLNVVWPPKMTLYPHNHRMWAAIGIYGGSEENVFYRRSGPTIERSGGRA
jgi:Methyltransferase domain